MQVLVPMPPSYPVLKLVNMQWLVLGAVVTKDIPEKAIVVGNPAIIKGFIK